MTRLPLPRPLAYGLALAGVVLATVIRLAKNLDSATFRLRNNRQYSPWAIRDYLCRCLANMDVTRLAGVQAFTINDDLSTSDGVRRIDV